MSIVVLTALGVGGATVLGAILGFIFKDLSARYGAVVLAFAAGVMMSASMIGLILPSLEFGGKYKVIVTTLGIFAGAECIQLLSRIVPRADAAHNPDRERAMLLVLGIAIHNLPEGIAAGVGFGSGDFVSALSVAGGIALQNVPEGMVIIAPMLSSGFKPSRTLILALFTGVIEVAGTFIGYFAVSVSRTVLPFALAFAGGAMLYIISDEIIPDVHYGTNRRAVSYSLLFGFCIMLMLSELLK